MRLAAVMDELGAKLEVFAQLSVHPYPVDSVTPDAAVFGYPDEIAYDETYGRGNDMINGLKLYMIAGRVDSLSSRNKVSAWTAGNGEKSIKQFIDNNNYTSCDSATVTRAQFDTISVADIDYIVAVFDIDISGDGEM